MSSRIIVPNFFKVGCNGDRTIKECDLGWPESIKQDAQSDYPETIFRYVVEIVGLNILFYWIKDRQFYTIETEKTPIEVRRLFLNPHWDGKYEINRADIHGEPYTNSSGDVLASFDAPTQIWNNLKIDGTPIGEVIENSFIVDMV